MTKPTLRQCSDKLRKSAVAVYVRGFGRILCVQFGDEFALWSYTGKIGGDRAIYDLACRVAKAETTLKAIRAAKGAA